MHKEEKVGQVLGELETDIMEIIWESSQPLAVKDVQKSLIKKRKVAYTTVMTIMGRLVAKGLLKRTSSGKAYSYLPSYTKDKFLTRVTRQIIKNFVSNFGDAAVTHFAEEIDKLSPDKQKELNKLLREARRKK